MSLYNASGSRLHTGLGIARIDSDIVTSILSIARMIVWIAAAINGGSFLEGFPTEHYERSDFRER